MIETGAAAKTVISAALKPVVGQVHQQWARRGAVTVDQAALGSLRSEVAEAIEVLARDAPSLQKYAWVWLKRLLSDVSPVFDDAKAIAWLRTEGAEDHLLAAVEALVLARPIEQPVADAGAHFHQVTGQEQWYGEALALAALAFITKSIELRLTTGDRMLAGMLAAHANPVQQRLDVMSADMTALVQRLDRRNGAFLQKEDFAPLPAAAAATVVIGRRPRLVDLRSGRFRERPGIVDAARAELLKWIDADGQEDLVTGRLPVFWIDGRPGDGKSVILLQTVAALLNAGDLPAITELQTREEIECWLASRERGVSPAPRRHWDIAYTDDLYRKFDSEELRQLVSHAYQSGSPLAAIITSGPTVERRAMENNDRLAITSFEVPRLGLGEMDEFRAWLEARTGEARDLPDGAGNRLLVEWLVELAGGMVDTDFADNLAATLERLGIGDAARITAAVNAMDLGAPGSLLSTVAARAAFDTLRDDQANHFELRIEEDQTGVHLLHPALVWPLFKLWVRAEENLALAWGRALARATVLFLNSGETWQARSLVGRALRGAVVSRLFGAGEVPDARHAGTIVLEAIYEHVAANCTLPERACLLGLWIPASGSRRLRHPSMAELAHEAAAAIADPLVDAAVKADLSASLLAHEHRGVPPACLAAALAHLSGRPVHLQIPAMDRLARHMGTGRRREFVTKWLSANIGAPEAGPVFSRALESRQGREFVQLAFDYLTSNPDAAEAGSVMWAATMNAEEDDRFFPVLAAWMNQTRDRDASGRIVARLLLSTGRPRPQALQKKAFDAFSSGEHAAMLSSGIEAFLDRAAGTLPAAQALAALVRHRTLGSPWRDRAEAHVRATSGNICRHVLVMLVRFAPSSDTLRIAIDLTVREPRDRGNEYLLAHAHKGLDDLSDMDRAAILAALGDREREILARSSPDRENKGRDVPLHPG